MTTRLRIFGSGRVLLENEDGRVLDDFTVADPEKAQQIVMEYLKRSSSLRQPTEELRGPDGHGPGYD
jgi:hypothetical protein